MATAVTADTYLQQIHTARTLINTCFGRAHELLTVKEANLLKELEDIQNNYEREGTSKQEELQDLEKSKLHLKNLLHDNDTLNKALAPINEKIEQILKLTSAPRTIIFQWNTELDRELQHVGEFVTTTVPQPVIPDYKNKSIPAISCKRGIAPGEEFYNPRGIAIEPRTGRIYIANCGNDKVQVFTPNGEYCFMFNSSMYSPWGICINNDTVYVSQWDNDCIVLYKLDGTYINKVLSEGTKKFKYPAGIAVNATTGYLYVCECSEHRVQVFDQNLKFYSKFGEKTLKCPRDVNLTTDSVIVLDDGNPCVHIFSITNYSLLSSIISYGANEQIGHSLFFCMDAALNIILTDFYRHHVKVFSMAGDFITQFGTEGHNVGEFTKPTGIVIDSQNRIVVVSHNKVIITFPYRYSNFSRILILIIILV